MIERLLNNPSIIVSGHRGLKIHYPENTLLAFQRALESGVDMLEFDLRMTKDRAVVVIHDDTVDRTTNGTGSVSDYRLDELKKLDAGGWFGNAFEGLKIPTFQELCDLIAPYPQVLLNVEIKPSADAKEVADNAVSMLEAYGYLERCVFTSFDADVVAYLHDNYRVKTQGFPAESMYNFVSGPDGTYSKMWAAAMSMQQLTPARVKELRDIGLQTWCYCPDDAQSVYYALGCGVTVMTCNDPFPAMKIREQISSAGPRT
ncbi:glycerophosphodiester phosphodiesterase family protein [Paenibacillus sp.]|uniref:glycerophosphodiester phosphodiesterase family protein n=1 Tax=Paenibacillus sp. TaxID=58172 RepID=UPI002D5A5492|nr:glycerophosphodiester phosphodiesterase family protein [Paenibacillus sp.]HZG56486.1 glycerophosphodiester phosphodiesterase family protein [Paenibacillus sp.]